MQKTLAISAPTTMKPSGENPQWGGGGGFLLYEFPWKAKLAGHSQYKSCPSASVSGQNCILTKMKLTKLYANVKSLRHTGGRPTFPETTQLRGASRETLSWGGNTSWGQESFYSMGRECLRWADRIFFPSVILLGFSTGKSFYCFVNFIFKWILRARGR